MKRTTFYFILFLSSSFLNGYSQSSLLTKGQVMAKGFVAEVNFEVVRGHILIPATVNGQSHRFLFDTGAPNMFVRELFGNGETDSLKISDTNNQKGQTLIGQIDLISLGNIDFMGFGALEFDFNTHYPLQCYDIAGIIGSNLFRGLAIKIDYENRKLIITDRIKNLAPKTKPIKMTLRGHQLRPLLHLKLGEHKKIVEEVLFDTGFNGFYTTGYQVFKQLAKYEGMYYEITEIYGKGSAGLYGTGEFTTQYFVTLSNFSIDKAAFRGVMTRTTQASSSILGADILKYGNAILDFRKKRFYFEQTKEYVSDPSQRPQYIASVEDGQYVIGFILDEKLKQQIQVGDRILKIDGMDITALDPCERYLTKSTAKERLVVQSSDGEVVEIVL